jgi:hypothetical protein
MYSQSRIDGAKMLDSLQSNATQSHTIVPVNEKRDKNSAKAPGLKRSKQPHIIILGCF